MIQFDLTDLTDTSGQIGSYQIILIITQWISQVSWVKLYWVKSYQLWQDGAVSSVRSNWIISNHINYDMMCQLDQSDQIESCQIISIKTWWISQVSQVKLDHVKSCWLWHDDSVRSVSSCRIMSNHINYEMMCQSGQLGKMGSHQIILIITWCFSQFRSDHFYSHWNSTPLSQQSGVLGWYCSQCRNILPQPQSLLDI